MTVLVVVAVAIAILALYARSRGTTIAGLFSKTAGATQTDAQGLKLGAEFDLLNNPNFVFRAGRQTGPMPKNSPTVLQALTFGIL
jgi:hypothetical protein